jgi:hypothetical protein
MKITTNITNRATRRELVPHSSWRKPAAKSSIISVGEQDADGDKLLLEDVQQIQQHQPDALITHTCSTSWRKSGS